MIGLDPGGLRQWHAIARELPYAVLDQIFGVGSWLHETTRERTYCLELKDKRKFNYTEQAFFSSIIVARMCVEI